MPSGAVRRRRFGAWTALGLPADFFALAGFEAFISGAFLGFDCLTFDATFTGGASSTLGGADAALVDGFEATVSFLGSTVSSPAFFSASPAAISPLPTALARGLQAVMITGTAAAASMMIPALPGMGPFGCAEFLKLMLILVTARWGFPFQYRSFSRTYGGERTSP